MSITIGADPEVFVVDKKTGEVQSSQGIIKGSKHKPFKTEHGFVHRDNVLAEMNVEPAMDAMTFADNVQGVMRDLSTMMKEHGKEIGLLSSNLMDIKYLDHYEAARFGCNENLNCWDIDTPMKPNAEEAGVLRTASGHVHIGFPFKDMYDQILAAQACELCIGLPSIAYDRDALRRTLYGRAGSFRPKPYGIEYTVPSNFWLKNRNLMKWVYNSATQAIHYRKHYSVNATMAEEIQDTINNCDVDNAKRLCNNYGINFPEVA